MGRPFVTGRISYTPEAEQQLNDLDDWIMQAASAEVAERFVKAILGHIDTLGTFPLAGQAHEHIRPGMRTTSHRRRTVIAYEVDDSSGEVVVTVLGIFHGGQDWQSALQVDPP